MLSSAARTIGSASSAKALGTSAVLHVAALSVLAGVGLTAMVQGSHEAHQVAIVLRLEMSEPQEYADDYESQEAAVLVMPSEARIADQRYFHTPVELTQPEVEQMLRKAQLEVVPVETKAVAETETETEVVAQDAPQTPQQAKAVPKPAIKAAYDPNAKLPDFVGNPPPIFPAAARSAGIEGRVVLEIDIDETGHLTRVEIYKSSGHPILDGAAVTQISRWRAKPAVRFGQPVATTLRLPVNFRLP